MAQFLRWGAGSGVSLPVAALIAFAGMAFGTAQAQETAPMADTEPMTVDMHAADAHSVTVGGTIEFLAGNSDHVDGVDGFDRGFYSRFSISYDRTLANGLEVDGRIGYHLNQNRGSDPTAFAPDVLFVSVGGGFGTISAGAHAGASCSMLPRPLAFTRTMNWADYLVFSPLAITNTVHFQEANYCNTDESISYATPSMGGFSAMVTFAPNVESTQTEGLKAAVEKNGLENRIDAAVAWTSSMGAADISLGAGFQTSSDSVSGANDGLDVMTIAGTIGFGAVTVGAAFVDDSGAGVDAITVGAKYALGNLTPAITYSRQETDCSAGCDFEDESGLVIGANYAMGGGFNIFLEYVALEQNAPAGGDDQEDNLLISGIILNF